MKGFQFSAMFKPRPGFMPTARESTLQMALFGSKIWYDPKLSLVEKPTPTPKDDEVLIKVGACGVCGSDTMFLGVDKDNYLRYSGHCKAPTILGHEYSGEAVAVGKNVTGIEVGDLLVAESMNWCGECAACRQGMVNQCERLEEIGFTIDGGFAEFLIAKEKYCLKVNELVDIYGRKEGALEAAALVEPAAVAYNGLLVRSGGFRPGAYVAVSGCGPVGLAAIGLAKASGAARIMAIDISSKRLDVAKRMGADLMFNPIELEKAGKSVASAVLDATNGYGAMVHVEATERLDMTIPQIEDSLSVGAKVVQIGLTGERVAMLPIKFQKKDAIYTCSIGSSGHDIWADVIRLVSSRRLDLSPMICGKYSLQDAHKAFKEAANVAPGKILVTPNR